jgi:sulfotransferase family protein
MTKPDFIIIGAMKSATSTLHTQLSLQPSIFMSTPKEPNYFSDDEQYALGDKWYESLFSNAEKDDLCGESSTHYTKLPDHPHTIERMKQCLDNPKLIYVMRHPIDRLISHYIHQWTQNVIKCDINQAIERYDELTAYSCYAMQLEPYFEQFGKENVLPIFTEAIKDSPQEQLQKIANFIGYKGAVSWHGETEPQNVSRERIRAFPGYDFLVKSKVMTQLRRCLVPPIIRNKIKNNLSMQHRPEISEHQLKYLTTIFDQELSKLSAWLGTEITCDNFIEKSQKVGRT